MATVPTQDSSITIIVHLNIKPDKVKRTLELWHEQIAHIEANEPAGNVKYTLFRNNSVENEFTVVQTFASKNVMEAWYKSAKHEEIYGKVNGEGLMEGEPVPRYLSRVAGTQA